MENSERDGNTRPPDLPPEKPEEPLQIAVKRREVKGKGEKERYKHLNAEFQEARRDKKVFLTEQCKEIEGKK